MSKLGRILGKAQSYAQKNPEKVTKYADKAGSFVNRKTNGKYADKVDGALNKVESFTGKRHGRGGRDAAGGC